MHRMHNLAVTAPPPHLLPPRPCSWIVKQSVGTTPVLLGQKLTTRYFRGRGVHLPCSCLQRWGELPAAGGGWLAGVRCRCFSVDITWMQPTPTSSKEHFRLLKVATSSSCSPYVRPQLL